MYKNRIIMQDLLTVQYIYVRMYVALLNSNSKGIVSFRLIMGALNVYTALHLYTAIKILNYLCVYRI